MKDLLKVGWHQLVASTECRAPSGFLRIKGACPFVRVKPWKIALRSAENLQIVLTYILKLLTASQCQASILFTSVFFQLPSEYNCEEKSQFCLIMKIRNIWFNKILPTASRQVQVRMCQKLHIGIILTRPAESIAGQKQLRKTGSSKRKEI